MLQFPELSIKEFDPIDGKKEKLELMVESSKDLKIIDYHDKKQVELVRRTRINLANERIDISKKTKEMREGAKNFQKEVIKIENTLIEIIKPEEDRLKLEELTAKELLEEEMKMARLPARKEKLNEIGSVYDVNVVTDMTDSDFEMFLAKERLRIEQEAMAIEAARLDKERKEIEEAKNKLEEERISREEAQKKREELAVKKEAADKARADAAIEQERREETCQTESPKEVASEANECLQKPSILNEIDVKAIIEIVEQYMEFVESDEYKEDNDYEAYISETVIEACYGKKGFEFINSII